MSKSIVLILLNVIGIISFLSWVFFQLKDLASLPFKQFFIWKRFKYPVIIAALIGIPALFLNYTPYKSLYHLEYFDEETYSIYCWGISLLISLVWIRYILKLDVYEKEKWYHVILVFILSMGTTYLCDILYPLFSAFGFNLNGKAVNDFIYCVFGIGLIEETVKFIPFLILLKFTKAINEPFDYLLYASVSALGFAFVENAMYLNNYGIQIIGARAFYAALAHMTFCSTVAYGLLLKKYKFTKYPSFIVFIVFFFIAMFIHGFYDFWLMNKEFGDYSGLTTLGFLITIHIWFTMKNNAINISPFYDKTKLLDNDDLKHHLVISLVGLFMISYIYMAIAFDIVTANTFFWEGSLYYAYIVFYIIMSFSQFNIIKGYLKPLNLPFNFLIPSLKKNNKPK